MKQSLLAEWVNPSELASRTAERLALAVAAACAENGHCSLALSGGSSVASVFEALRTHALPWKQVHFYFVDERCVPPDHAQSNFRIAQAHLFAPLAIPSEHIHRMEGEREDRDAAARDYAAKLPSQPLDVVLLGMGEDGHTASLFPGHAALQENTEQVLAVKGPKDPPWRLTLTFVPLRAARVRVGSAGGAGKQHAVQHLLEGADLPANQVGPTHWIFGRDAAPFGSSTP